MKRRSAIFGCAMMLVLAPIGALAQEATAPGLEISGGFMRASPMVAAAGAGFMTIRSTGPEDRLVAFRSPACTQPELHTHVHDNGMMRMRQVDAIDIPAGGEAVLQPGGLHLMFINLTKTLEEGAQVPVTLVFEKAGEVAIELPVKRAGAMN
ncbi:copper chaperone PCu(A)C [Sedimentimonas flavescens]|uniref:copper chaperone PCu(A)C n=1 Tax=Sedimentimonas flavescens TaxID=2851012 RepID=UPI0021A73607|nr:copper chaperone PCu(A)C [Sedimentimonas flavescens]MCT2539554.1 copper chaperone PCu(A)C [Sedimentimonas flavescens]